MDALIKALLALPDLAVSPPSLKFFLWYSNNCIFENQQISIATFKKKCEQNPQVLIPTNDRELLESYLAAWEKFNPALNTVINQVDVGWQYLFNKQIGADDMIPVFILLFSPSKADIASLENKLLFASEVNQNNFTITVLLSACQFIHENKDDCKEEEEKYATIIRDIFYENGLTLLHLESQLRECCLEKMRKCSVEIYAALDTHQINDYNVTIIKDEDDEISIFKKRMPKIIDMHTNISAPPLSEHKELVTEINKFISFYQIYISLNTVVMNHNVLERLRQVSYKFKELESTLDPDVTNARLEINTNGKKFLDIPDEKRGSVFNLLFAPKQEADFSLTQFMDFLHKKILSLDAAKEVSVTSTPSSSTKPA